MSSPRYLKQVLIEQAELDRLRERQIRDYSPEIRSMAKIQDDMQNILLRKDLSADEKLRMLSLPQMRFDKLKAETNTLRGETAIGGMEVPPIKKAKTKEEEKDKAEEDKAEEEAEEEEEEEPSITGKVSPIPAMHTPRTLGLGGRFIEKGQKLLDKIRNHPEIISANEKGEVVFQGKAVPDSKFYSLYHGMFTSGSNAKGAGLNEFLQALRLLDVQTDELSSESYRKAYGRTPLKGKVHHRGEQLMEVPLPKRAHKTPVRFAKSIGDTSRTFESPEASSPVDLPAADVMSKLTLSRGAKETHGKKKQEGKGLTRPPGNRPLILYVY